MNQPQEGRLVKSWTHVTLMATQWPAPTNAFATYKQLRVGNWIHRMIVIPEGQDEQGAIITQPSFCFLRMDGKILYERFPIHDEGLFDFRFDPPLNTTPATLLEICVTGDKLRPYVRTEVLDEWFEKVPV